MQLPLVARWLVLLTCACVFSAYARSQPEDSNGDARSQGMAGLRSMLATQWSAFANPSGMAAVRNPVCGIAYTNCFGIPELGYGAFVLGLPTRTGSFGVGYSAFGYSSFRKSRAVLAYGVSLTQKIRAGAGMHFLMLQQPGEYPDHFTIVPSLGMQWIPVKNLVLGAEIFNPARQKYTPAPHPAVYSAFRAGAGYSLGGEVDICLETEKQTGEPYCFFGGTEVTVKKSFVFRIGLYFAGEHGYSFGTGFRGKHLQIDLASKSHPVLGFSTSATLSYAIK